MPTRRKAVLAAEAKPTWLLALDDDLLRSIAAFLPMPTLVDFTAVQRRFSNCFTESGWLNLASGMANLQTCTAKQCDESCCNYVRLPRDQDVLRRCAMLRLSLPQQMLFGGDTKVLVISRAPGLLWTCLMDEEGSTICASESQLRLIEASAQAAPTVPTTAAPTSAAPKTVSSVLTPATAHACSSLGCCSFVPPASAADSSEDSAREAKSQMDVDEPLCHKCGRPKGWTHPKSGVHWCTHNHQGQGRCSDDTKKINDIKNDRRMRIFSATASQYLALCAVVRSAENNHNDLVSLLCSCYEEIAAAAHRLPLTTEEQPVAHADVQRFLFVEDCVRDAYAMALAGELELSDAPEAPLRCFLTHAMLSQLLRISQRAVKQSQGYESSFEKRYSSAPSEKKVTFVIASLLPEAWERCVTPGVLNLLSVTGPPAKMQTHGKMIALLCDSLAAADPPITPLSIHAFSNRRGEHADVRALAACLKSGRTSNLLCALDSQQMCGMPGDSRQGSSTCASQWLAEVLSGRISNVAFAQRVLQRNPYLTVLREGITSFPDPILLPSIVPSTSLEDMLQKYTAKGVGARLVLEGRSGGNVHEWALPSSEGDSYTESCVLDLVLLLGAATGTEIFHKGKIEGRELDVAWRSLGVWHGIAVNGLYVHYLASSVSDRRRIASVQTRDSELEDALLAQEGSLLNLLVPCCRHRPIEMRREVTLYFLGTLQMQVPVREIFAWPPNRPEYSVTGCDEHRAARLSRMRPPSAWIGVDMTGPCPSEDGKPGWAIGALEPPIDRSCLWDAEGLLGMHRLMLLLRDCRHELPPVEFFYRALELPYDDLSRGGLVAGAPDLACSPQRHVGPAEHWDFGAHGPVRSPFISVSDRFDSPLFFGWRMAARRGEESFTLIRVKPSAIPNLMVVDLRSRALAEGLHDLHGSALWTAVRHQEMLLTALDYNPKAPFSIPTEACERLEVAFRELADAQRHAGDSMGAVEWSSLTPDALLVRLLIDEWEAC